DVKGPTIAPYPYDSFSITPPTTEGTYNAYFIAAEDSSDCTSGISATYTMTNAVVVDVAPVITSVTGPVNGTYNSGQNLDLLVNFNKNVNVNTAGGIPQIGLTIGSTLRQAKYVSGSGTSVLVFRDAVHASDVHTD